MRKLIKVIACLCFILFLFMTVLIYMLVELVGQGAHFWTSDFVLLDIAALVITVALYTWLVATRGDSRK